MTNSEQPPTKCFSAILRRLLCSGSLPTHPSSDPEFTTSTHSTHIPKKTEPRKTDHSTATELLQPPPSTTTTPAGIVARLMGLDSFPNSPQTTRTSLGTILRSRSVNSVDFLPAFDQLSKQQLPHQRNSHHRRVRTSVSFREVPTFLQTQQNHDVFLFCFDKVQEFGKTDMGLTLKDEKSKKLDQKNKKERLNVDLKMNMKKKSQNQNLKGKSEEEVNSAAMKCRRKRKERNKKKGEDEVAVARQRRYKSRSQKYNHPLPKIVQKGDDDDQNQSRKGKKKSELKRREREREDQYNDEYCVKVLMEVCRLTEKETQGCVWMDRKVVNNFQEIGYELGHEILQVLLYEVVDDLCGCS